LVKRRYNNMMTVEIEALRGVTFDDVEGNKVTLKTGDVYTIHNAMLVNIDSDLEGATCFDVCLSNYEGGYNVFSKDTFKLVAIHTICTA
jgi:hypothetical protein